MTGLPCWASAVIVASILPATYLITRSLDKDPANRIWTGRLLVIHPGHKERACRSDNKYVAIVASCASAVNYRPSAQAESVRPVSTNGPIGL